MGLETYTCACGEQYQDSEFRLHIECDECRDQVYMPPTSQTYESNLSRFIREQQEALTRAQARAWDSPQVTSWEYITGTSTTNPIWTINNTNVQETNER